ncbi:Hypothetical_protein [Hexamita inflata]|uniref:Hypothetical_protein n=1 Tax=Hexamita inflata TaxID=28002 RepID=A0AA86ULI1_9EUKA|nr:Hypothetical protein HINF_LOCUS31668 [Hexamita inflata]
MISAQYITNILVQLSVYFKNKQKSPLDGIEPSTLRLTAARSNQLSYGGIILIGWQLIEQLQDKNKIEKSKFMVYLQQQIEKVEIKLMIMLSLNFREMLTWQLRII